MLRAAATAPFLLLAGCSWPVGDAPPSAREPVALTVAGLVKLFREECLGQRSANWARRKYRNIADGCWPDDCTGKIDSSLSWTVPSTSGKGSVEVTLDWWSPLSDGPPPHRKPLNCSIAVNEGDADLLRALLARIRADGRPLVPAPTSGTAYDADQAWEWQSANKAAAGPRVLLIRYFPDEKSYRAAVARAGNDPATVDGFELGQVRDHIAHPWQLRLDQIDVQRLPTRPCPNMAHCVEIITDNVSD